MRLPLNCNAEYFPNFISKEVASNIFNLLLESYHLSAHKAQYKMQDQILKTEQGKIVFIDQALYDSDKFPEDIWGKTMVWPKEIIPYKQEIEKITNRIFSVGVCIYYPDGKSGVAYHSDYSAYGDTTVIPSLSLGAERMFYLREIASQEVHELRLGNGSIIIMGEHCQDRYEHSLPIDDSCKRGRINLTFRQYGF